MCSISRCSGPKKAHSSRVPKPIGIAGRKSVRDARERAAGTAVSRSRRRVPVRQITVTAEGGLPADASAPGTTSEAWNSIKKDVLVCKKPPTAAAATAAAASPLEAGRAGPDLRLPGAVPVGLSQAKWVRQIRQTRRDRDGPRQPAGSSVDVQLGCVGHWASGFCGGKVWAALCGLQQRTTNPPHTRPPRPPPPQAPQPPARILTRRSPPPPNSSLPFPP